MLLCCYVVMVLPLRPCALAPLPLPLSPSPPLPITSSGIRLNRYVVMSLWFCPAPCAFWQVGNWQLAVGKSAFAEATADKVGNRWQNPFLPRSSRSRILGSTESFTVLILPISLSPSLPFWSLIFGLWSFIFSPPHPLSPSTRLPLSQSLLPESA